MDPIVIIGSGLAGYSVAKEYRKIKNDDVLIITQDDGVFYSKPMLSNGLAKNKTAEQIATASAIKMSEDNDIRVRRNTVITKINVAEKNIISDAGEAIAYSQLVLATGASPIELVVANSMADGISDKIFHVNSLQDYALFRNAIETNKRIAIVGAGLIGCEFANDLALTEHAVDIIGPSAYPLDKLVPAEVGDFLRNALSSIGIQWHLQATVESFHATDSGIVLALTNGEKIEADIVLSAIGLKPNLTLAEQAGIKVNRGIVVDKFLHTSETGIYALGDCAELDGDVLPFILPLMTEARALAQTLAGKATEVVYPHMPIVVKTPTSPLVTCPPDTAVAGRWSVDKTESGLSARFYDKEDRLKGFCLIGDAVSQKQSLVQLLG